jgi:murein tripeptide amidase MpaA
MWVLIVTQQQTGHYLTKPGYWIDANTHAGEVTGSAVALYCLYQLVTQYGQDPQMTYLLDHYTIYILPRLAVDGAEKYLTTPYCLRSSIRAYPYPEERDGLYPEDINQDGLILQMRIQDACGAWKVSEQDARVMVRREPEEFGGTYYTLLTEGLIRNYDQYEFGLAPSPEGMDFNRNYPHLWAPEGQQPGAGDFPFSEPETRAEAEFWQQHRNINGFISYHTYSAVILRPYSTHADDYFPVEDLEIYKDGSTLDMYAGGAKNADAVILADRGNDEKLTAMFKPARSKKVLNFSSETDDVTEIMELYNNLAGK